MNNPTVNYGVPHVYTHPYIRQQTVKNTVLKKWNAQIATYITDEAGDMIDKLIFRIKNVEIKSQKLQN